MVKALAGLRAYGEAPRPLRPAGRPIVAAAGRARLRDCGGTGAPLVLVPSLINPPDILDLDADRSLAGFLAGRGFRVLLVDWGEPGEADRTCGLSGHVELLAALLADLDRAPHVVGYCLGGTLAAGLPALRPVRSLAMLAAPWRFGGFPAPAREAIGAIWSAARPLAEALGALPMEALQAAFWRIDPARTIAKFERFADAEPASPFARRFVRLEDWANAGPPLPLAFARALAEDLFGADLTGTGGWVLGGRRIEPATLGFPVLDVVSTSDRIVPAATASGAGIEMRLSEGHVGMVVGSSAHRALWEPLSQWLSGVPAI